MSHDTNAQAVERLARELREEDRLTTMDDGTDWHEISRFILRRFVRKSDLLPSGMTVGDLRGYRDGYLRLGGTEYNWEYRLAGHLLALLEPEEPT
jgi:hypothetical protein